MSGACGRASPHAIPLTLLLASLVALPGAAQFAAAAEEEASRPESLAGRIVAAALEQTRQRVVYDGSYRKIPYPGGDVPKSIGVCTDLVIRAYRVVGIDFQRLVHEDMRKAFDAYPKVWGSTEPDPNIDHRRVLNLRVFLRRAGAELPASSRSSDYRPGDLVTWRLPGGRPHIGIVAEDEAPGGERPLIIHNIGDGPEVEDVLFRYKITGHYRYPPSE